MTSDPHGFSPLVGTILEDIDSGTWFDAPEDIVISHTDNELHADIDT